MFNYCLTYVREKNVKLLQSIKQEIYPTTNGMQNGISVGICTQHIHIFCTHSAPTCKLSSVLINKIYFCIRSAGRLLKVRCRLGTFEISQTCSNRSIHLLLQFPAHWQLGPKNLLLSLNSFFWQSHLCCSLTPPLPHFYPPLNKN